MLNKRIPGLNVPKKIYRLLRYKNEWKKTIREIPIKSSQEELLRINYPSTAKKLIIFIIPGVDWETGKERITGGTISIVSFCEETAALNGIHGAETIMCTFHESHLLLKHEMFESNTFVYRFSQLPRYFSSLENLIIHLPEFMIEFYMKEITSVDLEWLGKIEDVQINVMNQNIKLMPGPEVIKKLKDYASKVTITTAHQKYCTPYFREYYGVPLHKLSVWISPEQYDFVYYAGKEDLMIVSPDPHPRREYILDALCRVEGLKIVIINNLTYSDYKKVISRAKWALTFGEGLDGYFIEPVFSGAISFAFYNDHFFTADFGDLPTVIHGEENAAEKIISLIKNFDKKSTFDKCQHELFSLCEKYYSKDQYRKNIRSFYLGDYTFS
jgi:hypothetical protein